MSELVYISNEIDNNTTTTISSSNNNDNHIQNSNDNDHDENNINNNNDDDDNNDLNANNKWSKNGYGEPCARSGGKFSREESELVRRAVEEYCSIKQISTSRLCSECDHKAELKGAWMEIAKRLPHRTVQSVYRHGLRQLHPFKRGPWTEIECTLLLDLVTRMGKKWSAIQAKLNRSADSCRDKYREMSTEYVKGRWKDNETEILKRLIREHLRADPNADIKELGKMVEREAIIIPWSVISKRMIKRSRLSCFKKWQKMTGLYSPSDQQKVASETMTAVAAAGPSVVMDRPASSSGNSSVALIATTITAPMAQTPIIESARNAPTAGAAAAAAAAASRLETHDFDFILLSEIVNSGAVRESEMDWESVRVVDANQRWNSLFEEWLDEVQPDDEILELPIFEIARLLLERKQQAKMAAETVEAVDLPTLKTREV